MRQETRHSLSLGVTYALTSVLGIFYFVYVGRVLGPATFADFAAAVAFATFCYTASGPVNGTVTRFTSHFLSRDRPGQLKRFFQEVHRRLLFFVVGSLALGALFIQPLSQALRLSSPLILTVAFVMVSCNLFLNVPRGVLRGSHRFTPYGLNLLIEAATRLLFGVLFLWLSPSVFLGLISYVLAQVIAYWVSSAQLRPVWRGVEPERLDGGPVLRYALAMFLLMVTSAGFQNIDMLFVRFYYEDVSVGLYGASLGLGRSMGMLVAPFTVLVLPLLSGHYERGQVVAPTLLRLIAYFLVLAALPLLAFWQFPELIMRLAYGEAFLAATPLLLPVAVLRLTGFLCHLLALACASMDRFGLLWAYCPGLVLQVVVMAFRPDSPKELVFRLLAAQALTLVGILVILVLGLSRTKSPINPSPNPLPESSP